MGQADCKNMLFSSYTRSICNAGAIDAVEMFEISAALEHKSTT